MDAILQSCPVGGIATFTATAIAHYVLVNKYKKRNMRGFPSNCEVLVVGAGVAGASAAYALSSAGVRNIGNIYTNTKMQGIYAEIIILCSCH